MIKRTLFNSRNKSLYDDYTDTNNYLFTIIFDSGAELNLICRALNQNNTFIKNMINKIFTKFDNILEIHHSKLSIYEYDLLKQYKTPSVTKLC